MRKSGIFEEIEPIFVEQPIKHLVGISFKSNNKTVSIYSFLALITNQFSEISYTYASALVGKYPEIQKISPQSELEKVKNIKPIKKIIGSVLEKMNVEAEQCVKIEVVSGGKSGATVLSVEYNIEKEIKEKSFLKIDHRTDKLHTELNPLIENRKRENQKFQNMILAATDCTYSVEGYGVLRYNYYDNSTTLIEYLKKKIKDNDKFDIIAYLEKNIAPVLSELREYLGKPQKLKGEFKLLGWSSTINFDGCRPENRVLNNFIKYIKEQFSAKIDESTIAFFSVKVDKSFESLGIPILNEVITAKNHGDLHAKNILVNKDNGTNPKVIDFALFHFGKKRHAFYDYVKLAVNLEVALFSNISLNKPFLIKHKNFLLTKETNQDALFNMHTFFYESIINDFSKLYNLNLKIDDSNLWWQYQLLRIHRLIKEWSYAGKNIEAKKYTSAMALEVCNCFFEKFENSCQMSSQ